MSFQDTGANLTGMPSLPDVTGDFSEATPPSVPGKPPNPFQRLTPAQELGERQRLNYEAGRGGTLAGSTEAVNAAVQSQGPAFDASQNPTIGDVHNAPFGVASGLELGMTTTDEQDAAKKKLDDITNDMLAYRSMPSYRGFVEGAASLGAQLAGGATSPENYIFPEIKVGNAVWRAAHPFISDMVAYGLGQAAVQAVADPVAQAAQIRAGLKQDYSPVETSLAIPMGFAFGGAAGFLHAAAGVLFKPNIEGMANVLKGEKPPLSAELQTAVAPPPEPPPPEVRGDLFQSTTANSYFSGPTTKPATARSLTEFIRDNGGLKPSPEVTAIYGRNNLNLVRKDGMSLDRAREAAVEAGYIVDNGAEGGGVASTTTRDLLDALAAEDKGARIHPQGETGATRDVHLEEARNDIYSSFTDMGLDPNVRENKDVFARAVEMRYTEGVDPDTAVERAVMEHDNVAGNEGHHPPAANEIPYDAAAASRAGGDNPGARQPGNDALGGDARAAGGLHGAGLGGEAQADVAARARSLRDTGSGAAPGTSRTAPVKSSGEIVAPVENLSNAIRRIADELNIAVRKGPNEKGAVASYNFKTQIARLTDVTPNSFSDFAHELGHHVENVVGGDLSQLIYNNPNTMRAFLAAYPDLPKMKAQDIAREGFGEFMAAYITNPARALAVDPQFADAFRQIMQDKAPDLLKTLDGARAAYAAYQAAPSRAVGEAMVVSRTELGETPMRDPLKRGPVAQWFSKVYTNYVNRNHPLAVLQRYAAESYRSKYGRLLDIPPENDIVKLMQMFDRGGYQMTQMDLTYGVQNALSLTPEGPALFSTIRRVTSDPISGAATNDAASASARLKAFDSYLIARWHRTLRKQMDAGETSLARPPTRLTDGDAAQIIADTEKAYPNFPALAEEVYAYNKKLIQKEFDAHLRTRESYDALMDPKHHEYVPLRRDMREATEAFKNAAGQGEKKGLETLGRYTRQGSDRDILSPVESIMLRNASINDQMTENWIKLGLRDLARTVGGKEGAQIAEEIPNTKLRAIDIDTEETLIKTMRDNGWTQTDAEDFARDILHEIGPSTRTQLWRSEAITAGRKPVVFGWDRGQRFALQLPDGEFGRQVQNVLDSIGTRGIQNWAQAGGLIFDVLASTAGTLRAGATTTPTFMVKNVIRDAFMQYLLVPEADTLGTATFARTFGGGASFVKGDEFWRMYSALGGIKGGIGAQAISDTRRVGDLLTAAGVPGHRQVSFHSLKEVLSVMEVSETAGRVGLFKTIYESNIKMGRTQRYAMFDAAQKARDFIDYGRYGSRMEMMSKIIPFLNANVQGVDKFFRTYVGSPTNPGIMFKPFTEQQALRQQQLRNALIPRVTSIAAISAAITFAYKDDPVYQRIPEQTRAQYWIFRLPFIKSGTYNMASGGTVNLPEGMQGAWVVVPKPWEPASIFNLAEKAVEFANTQDTKEVSRYVGSLGYSFNVPWELPILKTMSGLNANYDTFFERPIVPDHLKNVAPHLQASEYTSKFYVALAHGLNMVWDSKDAHDWFRQNIPVVGAALGAAWSPMEAQYLMQGVLGDWPRELGGIGGIVSSLANGDAINVGDVPGLRAILRDKMAAGEPMRELYNQIGQNGGRLTVAANSFKHLVDAGDPLSAQQYFSALDGDQRDFVRLSQVKGAPLAMAIHPLNRTANLNTAVRNVRDGVISDNGLATVDDPNTRIQIERGLRPVVAQALSEFATVEARNGLIVQGVAGFKNLPIVDSKPYLDVIKQASPALYNELSARLAQKKVMPIETVQAMWPREQRVLRLGGDPAQMAVELKGLGIEAASQGYLGGGMKAGKGALDSQGFKVKPGKRTPIPLAAEGATQ